MGDCPGPDCPAVKEETVAAASKAEMSIELTNIYFDFDSFVLKSESRKILESNAEIIKKQKPDKIVIEGHCDERGSDEYNLVLGEKRAKAAMNYLIALGVPATTLSVISYGKEKPTTPEHSESAWAKNRRAEFLVITK